MNNIPIPNNKTIDEHAEPLVEDYNLSILPKLEAVDVETFAQKLSPPAFSINRPISLRFYMGMAFFEEAKVIVDNLDLKRPNKEPMEVFKIFLENDKLGKKKEHAFGQLLCIRSATLFNRTLT